MPVLLRVERGPHGGLARAEILRRARADVLARFNWGRASSLSSFPATNKSAS